MDSRMLGKVSLAPDEGNMGNPAQSIKSIMSEGELKEELKAFRAVFPIIIKDVTEGLGELEDVRKWIVDCFFYNVAHGNHTYCLSTVLSYKLIVGKANCSSEKLFLARILSWCVEMCISFLFMADDIMDRSVTRRSNLCWYRKVSRECLIGQYLDMQATLPMKRPNLRNFTFEKYTQIVKAKSTPVMVLTIALAVYLAGYKKELVKHPKVDGILRKILFLIQKQNDFLDCFGDISETGKIGNDIENGKCTWLIVTALQKASESQLNILEDNYGVDAPNCKEKVLKVYKDLRLDAMYLELEQREYEEIIEEAQQLSNDEKLRFFQPVIINLANLACERKYAAI